MSLTKRTHVYVCPFTPPPAGTPPLAPASVQKSSLPDMRDCSTMQIQTRPGHPDFVQMSRCGRASPTSGCLGCCDEQSGGCRCRRVWLLQASAWQVDGHHLAVSSHGVCISTLVASACPVFLCLCMRHQSGGLENLSPATSEFLAGLRYTNWREGL